jgi:hypothetical protein
LQVRCGLDGPGSGPPIDGKNWFATLAPVFRGFLPYSAYFIQPADFRPLWGDGIDHIEIGMTRCNVESVSMVRFSSTRFSRPPYPPDYFDPYKILYPARLELFASDSDIQDLIERGILVKDAASREEHGYSLTDRERTIPQSGSPIRKNRNPNQETPSPDREK